MKERRDDGVLGGMSQEHALSRVLLGLRSLHGLSSGVGG
jgi:hypothetical protein